jgi:hypothetical protein
MKDFIMPNWCESLVSIAGPEPDIELFKQAHIRDVNGEIILDFNTAIPIPEGAGEHSSLYEALFALGQDFSPTGDMITDWFRGTHAHPSHWEGKASSREQLLEWYEANRPDDLAAAKNQIRFHERTGYYDWYEWKCANWGTKWNCGSYWPMSESPGSFEFGIDTAWSPSIPVFTKLAEMHPSLAITVKYEERGNWFAGTVIYHDGVKVSDEQHEPEPDNDDLEDVT